MMMMMMMMMTVMMMMGDTQGMGVTHVMVGNDVHEADIQRMSRSRSAAKSGMAEQYSQRPEL
jgi:hypothetical protein